MENIPNFRNTRVFTLWVHGTRTGLKIPSFSAKRKKQERAGPETLGLHLSSLTFHLKASASAWTAGFGIGELFFFFFCSLQCTILCSITCQLLRFTLFSLLSNLCFDFSSVNNGAYELGFGIRFQILYVVFSCWWGKIKLYSVCFPVIFSSHCIYMRKDLGILVSKYTFKKIGFVGYLIAIRRVFKK
jgi:hypothetical protein